MKQQSLKSTLLNQLAETRNGTWLVSLTFGCAILAEWNRSGTWTIVKGNDQLLINDETRTIKEGESVVINKEDKYSIKAIGESPIIEVQIGDELVEEDIERFEWDWE